MIQEIRQMERTEKHATDALFKCKTKEKDFPKAIG